MVTSCLKDMPETIPENVKWNPELAFPLGEDSFGLNALSGFDTTLFNLDTISGLPDWVDELEVVMEGTLDFDLYSIQENLEKINRILFRFKASNGFPNEVKAQAYFQDGGLNNVDSMFSEGPLTLPAGVVQEEGESVKASVIIKDAIFEKDRIQSLQNVNTIFFRATVLLAEVDHQLITYYPAYHLDLEIGAMLDLRLEY